MPQFDSWKHHRRSVRLPEHDYLDGAYFVTICTHQRECRFGHVDGDGVMHHNALGDIVREEWLNTSQVRSNVILDAFVVMPNHFHGILFITPKAPANTNDERPVGTQHTHDPANSHDERPAGVQHIHDPTNPHDERPVGTQRAAPLPIPTSNKRPGGVTSTNVQPGSLGAIVRAFKSAVTKRINDMRDTPGGKVWQRSYYDTWLRSEAMLNARRAYVQHNPARWTDDENHPDNVKLGGFRGINSPSLAPSLPARTHPTHLA